MPVIRAALAMDRNDTVDSPRVLRGHRSVAQILRAWAPESRHHDGGRNITVEIVSCYNEHECRLPSVPSPSARSAPQP